MLLDGNGQPRKIACDARLEPRLFGAKRLLALAASALVEAIGKLEPKKVGMKRLPVLLALPENRPGFTEADAKAFPTVLATDVAKQTNVEPVIEIAGRGHAGGLLALQVAEQRLLGNQIETCAIVGADTYFDLPLLDRLDSDRRIVAEGVRGGFIPGEGGAAVILATTGALRAMRLVSLAKLRSTATARETRLIGGDDEVLGQGLTAAIAAAMESVEAADRMVDAVFCDINGERYRADEWAMAVLRIQGTLKDATYEAPADCWGDVGAASGVLGCVLAARAWARGYSRGPRALVWASSEGGLRGAAVLEAPS
jgi:3-oxoacyl-[acyl-carrier-protein] synthase-1